jgi:hypothetical protein
MPLETLEKKARIEDTIWKKHETKKNKKNHLWESHKLLHFFDCLLLLSCELM